LREHNQEADRLANEAMDKGLGRKAAAPLMALTNAPQEFEGVVQNGVIRVPNGDLPEGTRVQIRVKR
jgi:probable phosphoglycerate mutase